MQLVRDIGKRAVAVIVIEPVSAALQSSWAAGDWNPAISAERPLPEFGQVFEIEVNIVGDVQIEVAVVVVVPKSSTGSPSAQISNPGFLRYIGERTIVV